MIDEINYLDLEKRERKSAGHLYSYLETSSDEMALSGCIYMRYCPALRVAFAQKMASFYLLLHLDEGSGHMRLCGILGV